MLGMNGTLWKSQIQKAKYSMTQLEQTSAVVTEIDGWLLGSAQEKGVYRKWLLKLFGFPLGMVKLTR